MQLLILRSYFYVWFVKISFTYHEYDVLLWRICQKNAMCNSILSVPLTWSIPMWRAVSGSELSRWNFTAENKSPSQAAASPKARHSSSEGRPHLNDSIRSRSLWRSDTLATLRRAAQHSPSHGADPCRRRFRGKKHRVWPVEGGCQGSSAAGQQKGPCRRQKNGLCIYI